MTRKFDRTPKNSELRIVRDGRRYSRCLHQGTSRLHPLSFSFSFITHDQYICPSLDIKNDLVERVVLCLTNTWLTWYKLATGSAGAAAGPTIGQRKNPTNQLQPQANRLDATHAWEVDDWTMSWHICCGKAVADSASLIVANTVVANLSGDGDNAAAASIHAVGGNSNSGCSDDGPGSGTAANRTCGNGNTVETASYPFRNSTTVEQKNHLLPNKGKRSALVTAPNWSARTLGPHAASAFSKHGELIAGSLSGTGAGAAANVDDSPVRRARSITQFMAASRNTATHRDGVLPAVGDDASPHRHPPPFLHDVSFLPFNSKGVPDVSHDVLESFWETKGCNA